MIEADNSLDLLTGVKVNVTTTNDDGTVTYQILEIDYKRLGGGGGIWLCARVCNDVCVGIVCRSHTHTYLCVFYILQFISLFAVHQQRKFQ